METTSTIRIQAPPEAIYRLAAAVERWPDILPHYRWVRVRDTQGHRRTVEMAARRDILWRPFPSAGHPDQFPLTPIALGTRRDRPQRPAPGRTGGDDSRPALWIPVRWVAVQELFPEEPRITFRHVGGLTRGMDVAWTLRPIPSGTGTEVRIWHRFDPGWPLIPDAAVHAVVGRFFVHFIAGQTLARIKTLAERDA